MAERKTAAEAVRELDALTGQKDLESDHSTADEILLAVVPREVREAYYRVVQRSKWWA